MTPLSVDDYLMLNLTDSLDLRFLAKQPRFPPELLHQFAIIANNPFVLREIIRNPNTLAETRVMLSLMDVTDFDVDESWLIT